MSAMGRPEREYRSAQRVGTRMSAMGRPGRPRERGEAEAQSARPRTWTAAESATLRFAQVRTDGREYRSVQRVGTRMSATGCRGTST